MTWTSNSYRSIYSVSLLWDLNNWRMNEERKHLWTLVSRYCFYTTEGTNKETKWLKLSLAISVEHCSDWWVSSFKVGSHHLYKQRWWQQWVSPLAWLATRCACRVSLVVWFTRWINIVWRNAEIYFSSEECFHYDTVQILLIHENIYFTDFICKDVWEMHYFGNWKLQ